MDIQQTVMQGYFTMMMAVDVSQASIPVAELARRIYEKIVRRAEKLDNAPVMPEIDKSSEAFIVRGGRIPTPLQSLKN